MRLTQKDDQGNWSLKGVKWEQLHVGRQVTQELWEKLYGALWKLMEYEDTELSPEDCNNYKIFEDDCISDRTTLAGLLRVLRTGKNPPCWIPVEERLPEEEGNYLVTMVTPGYLCGQPYTNWLYWDAADCDWLTDEAHKEVLDHLTECIAERKNNANKPFTQQELQGLAGKPVYCPEIGSYGIVKYETIGIWAGVPFLVGVWHRDGVAVNFEYNIMERELKCYKINEN